VKLAQEAGAKQLALFHHEPEHADLALDDIVKRARSEAGKGKLEVFAATEGANLKL
jgi:ribonuclease BN (tRNA processing enzyme)